MLTIYGTGQVPEGLKVNELCAEKQYSKEVEEFKARLEPMLLEVLNTPVSKLKKKLRIEKQVKRYLEGLH